MLAFIVAGALASAGDAHSLFLFDDQCVVLDASGKVSQQVDLKKAGFTRISDADVNPAGTRILVTAWSDEANNTVLFELDLATGGVERRGESIGFHAAPSYSRDGKWIQFAHHPTLGGPVGMHEARAYAQLYRQSADGKEAPTKLTTSDGCHMESTSSSGEKLYFAHANCRGGRRIEVLVAGKEQPVTEFESHMGEPSLSADGKVIVVTRVVGDGLEIIELDATSRKARQLWSGTRFQDQFRPRYLGKTRDVVFQNGREVFRLERGSGSSVTVTKLWSFR